MKESSRPPLSLLARSGRVADRESGTRTGPKSSARSAALCVRAVPVAAGRTRALLLATRGWVAIRCSTPTLLARAGKVAQNSSAAVTIAEALPGVHQNFLQIDV